MRRGMSGAAMMLLAGCGARGGLDLGGDGSDQQCGPLPGSDVAECVRQDPEALPLARIASLPGEDDGRSGASLGEDTANLYFVSESRVFRVSKNGGTPEALTAIDTADGGISVAGDSLYWSYDDWVTRMPLEGGSPQAVVELPLESWTVGPDVILSWHYGAKGMPLRSTSLATGETTVLWEGLVDQSIRVARADQIHVYVALQYDLYRVPLAGGAAERLVGDGPAGGSSPRVVDAELMVTDDHVYFGAMDPFADAPAPGVHWPSYGIYRVAKASPQTPERVTDGFAWRMVGHGGDLFLDVVMPANDGPQTRGAIVRVPRGGGEVERIADSDAVSIEGSVFDTRSQGLAASDCHAYFHLRCDDEVAWRLVAMPYGEAAAR